jgi:hypothetical protein
MIPTLVLSISMLGWFSNAQARPNRTPPRTHAEMQAFDRAFLENHRRAIAIMEDHIKFLERFERDRDGQWRLNRSRDILRGWKKLERELVRWEDERRLNPGFETDMAALARLERIQNEIDPPREWTIAPLPREVKK